MARYGTSGPFGGLRSRVPRITSGAAWIAAVEIAALLLYLFLTGDKRAELASWLALQPTSLAHVQVWKLATTVLFSLDPVGRVAGLSFFFNLLMLWLFMPTLEQTWGTRKFLIFFAMTQLVANLAAALLGLVLPAPYPHLYITGITPFTYAAIAAFGVLYADQPVQLFGAIPIKGRQLAIGTVVVIALFVLLQRDWLGGAAFFTAMATAWGFTRGTLSPTLWWLRFRRWRLRNKYQVLDGGVGRGGGKKEHWLN